MDDITPPPQPIAPVTAQPQPVPAVLAATTVEPASSHKVPKTAGKLRSILSTLSVLIIAPLLALTITAFIFQSYEVDGPSMQSTLQNQDRLIIWKLGRTWARATKHDYIPNRGDVIVFTQRGLYEDNGGKEKQLIKRVIALPGERVTVKDGKVTVYNAQHVDGFVPDTTLPYGNVITTTEGNVDLTVPAGEVFVCGDNRANSLDSRYFGPIRASDIVGKLLVRVLPLGNAKSF